MRFKERLVVLTLSLLLWPGASLKTLALDEQPIPQLKSPVTDITGTLTQGQISAIENDIRQLTARKGSQIAVLIINTTYPETIEDYSIRLAEEWKIGRENVDDGVILLVAKKDRKLRIEVGYGLEGAITDQLSKRIITQIITPEFKSGDFYHGIAKGVQSLEKLIDGESLPEPSHEKEPSDGFSGIFLLIPLMIFLSPMVSGIFSGKKSKGKVIGRIIMFLVFLIIFSWMINFIVGFFISLFLTLFSFASPGNGRGGHGGGYVGGSSWGGGGYSGGGFSGGGFSGGGGSFGGGGASGSW